jgi:aldose 1-epimerase
MIFNLTSKSLDVKISSLGGRLMSCVFEGQETTFGAGSDAHPDDGDLYSGVLCGRHAGRITGAVFPLDGQQIEVAKNQGPNHLHGGFNSFGHRQWTHKQDGNRVELKLHSPEGEEGFPGAMDVTAVYELKDNVLSLSFEATTTKPTLCNLTNHAYWNMAASEDVLGHELTIFGSKFFPLDDAMLPLGEIKDVAGTSWDFREPRSIGGDYDNCFLLDGKHGDMKPALRLRDPASKRILDVLTTERCVQIYTAWHWEPSIISRSGPIKRSQAFAIEPQCVADAPNHPAFPQSVLRPGEVYRNAMEWRFS